MHYFRYHSLTPTQFLHIIPYKYILGSNKENISKLHSPKEDNISTTLSHILAGLESESSKKEFVSFFLEYIHEQANLALNLGANTKSSGNEEYNNNANGNINIVKNDLTHSKPNPNSYPFFSM